MKKILAFLVVLLLSITPSFAQNINEHKVKFNGEEFTLFYSVKSDDINGYMNEYYKRGETYNIWSEMIGVHHFPNAYSPIDKVVELKNYLSAIKCPSSITFDDKKNTAMIDFIMISDNHSPVIMEFNVFKYSKAENCGSIALQYAKRYVVKNEFEAEAVKKEFAKNRKKMLKRVKKLKTPDIINEEIDKLKGIIPQANEGIKENKTNEKELIQPEISDKEENNNTEIVTDEAVEESAVNNEAEEELKSEIPSNDLIQESNVTEVNYKEEAQTLEDSADESDEIIPTEQESPAKAEDNKDTAEEAATIKEELAEQGTPEIKPADDGNAITSETTSKKVHKAKKEKPYKIENLKDDFYAQPQNYKEIKARHKQQAKEAKKLKKINAKKEAKARAKKAAKKLAE